MEPFDRREYFRVHDVFPVIVRKISHDVVPVRSQAFPALSNIEFDEDFTDESIHPKLWELLLHINCKLSLILEKLSIESDGLTEEKNMPVTLSEVSLDFRTSEKYELQDKVEIKMLLPSVPPARLLVYGEVVRVDEPIQGTYKVVTRFVATDQTVRSFLSKYILKRQREIIAQNSGFND